MLHLYLAAPNFNEVDFFIMREKEWYKDWFSSPYYDVLYRQRDEEEASGFLRQLIKFLNCQKGQFVLDVACGKGRHSRALAHIGLDVTGIDISVPSIEVALKYEKENLHFFVHDMRLPFRINYFDYAFNFFTSFGYFHTDREHDNAVRTIAQSLKPDGRLVIDYLNVHYNEDNINHIEEKVIDGIKFHIARWHDEAHFYKRIQIEDPQSHNLKHLFTEKVEKFSLGDFTDMLAYQGLMVEDVFGDYALGPYHIRKTPRMIMVARKIH